jgi:hypothetical protein
MITFKNGITKSTLDFVLGNLQRLGEIQSLSHKRDKSKIFYETIIKGSDDTMIISGGIGSGYSGEGPGGMLKLLLELGVPEDKARAYVYDNTDTEHNFEVIF